MRISEFEIIEICHGKIWEVQWPIKSFRFLWDTVGEGNGQHFWADLILPGLWGQWASPWKFLIKIRKKKFCEHFLVDVLAVFVESEEKFKNGSS